MNNVNIPARAIVLIGFIIICTVQNVHAQKHANITNVQELIKKNATTIGLSPNDVLNTRIADSYYDQLSGATLVYLQQTFKAIDVYNSLYVLAFKSDKPVSVAGSFVRPNKPLSGFPDNIPVLSATGALTAAAEHLQIKLPQLFTAKSIKPGASKETLFGTLDISANDIKARMVWLHAVESKQLTLSWLVEIQPAGTPDYWIVKVDAATGQVLGKDNLTIYDNLNIQRVELRKDLLPNNENGLVTPGFETPKGVKDITSATYRVIPYPAESPIHAGGTPALRTNPWMLAPAGSHATSLQWHYDGTTYFDSTRGNNVLAQEDHNSNNGLGQGAHSSSPEPSLLFDYPPDFSKQPTDSLNQGFAITNLFYWTNIMHDISYLYGFDEVSGNFQRNNMGRGGLENDYLLADAQDGSGFNNANFTSTADGKNPRMQIFLFGGSPQRDGALDNGIICHEYAHGISGRLTGGPSNPGCLVNKEQMGEGWSDYFALMLTTNWANAQLSDGIKKRPFVTYPLGQPVTGPGWRKYPYSTDMSVNPYTYAALLETGGEAHKVGEIWTTVLWDMTWEIISKEGLNPDLYNVNGSGGNSIAMKLVMEGLKLQPCRPGFLDGRDAILKADTLLYDARYSCAIWKAFAKRGMGLYAKQGSSDSYTDQVVDFSTYNFPAIVKHVDKSDAAQGETITYSIKVIAPRCEAISGITIVDTLPGNVNYISSKGTYNPTNKTVTTTGIDLNAGESKSFSITVKVNENSYMPSIKYISDSIKQSSISPAFTTTSTTNTFWQTSALRNHSATYSYLAKDSSGTTNQTLQSSVYTLEGKTFLTFWHYYDTEAGYDGGVLDISTDNGNTWEDLGPYITQNGYNARVIINTPLIGGRLAYTGSSNNQFVLTRVDLSAFTGKTIAIRFVSVSDESGGADGWYIDDINLVSETAIFNTVKLFNSNMQLKAIADTITTIKNSTIINLCPNGNTSFSSNTQGNDYHWQINAGGGYTNIVNNLNYSGANTANLQLSNVPSAWYGYLYRCIVDGNTANAFSIQFVNLWTGAINTAWENGGNWSCGSVPNGNTDVVIKSGSVIINSNASCKSLRADVGVTIAVNPMYKLTVTN